MGEAVYVRDAVLPAMEAVREAADQLEQIVADDLWPLPKYSEILFVKEPAGPSIRTRPPAPRGRWWSGRSPAPDAHAWCPPRCRGRRRAGSQGTGRRAVRRHTRR